MQYVFVLLTFLFGAAIGSFIAVIAHRRNTGLHFFKGRSFCFSCNAKLQNKDLVPIFSFLFLKGRCRYCESKIPKETLLIEILMGTLSVLAALNSGFVGGGSLIEYLLLTAVFATILLISVYDLKHFIIPDSFLVSFFLSSLLYSFFVSHSQIFWLLVSGIIVTLPFLLIFIFSKGKWLGFGDVKYIFVIGFFLGLVQGLSAVIFAFWIGAAFSLLVILLNRLNVNLPISRNRLTIKSEIPFGPFLSMGTIISFYTNADVFQIHFLSSLFQ